jgi:acetylglutamate kinase
MLHIIKIGGNVIDKESDLKHFLSELAQIPEPKILVHGGGKLATDLSQRLGIESQMIDGRRVTDAETLKIVSMVYAGWINKHVVAQLQALGASAIGLSGADADSIRATKRPPKNGIDYGWVGDVSPENVNTTHINGLLEAGLLPVFCPITHDGQGQLLNTNADTIAASLAKALSQTQAVKLIYCFEKQGVLSDAKNEDSVISFIDTATYADLKTRGVVSGGMIPKLDNAFDALAAGVHTVVIGQAQDIKILATANNTKGTSIRK